MYQWGIYGALRHDSSSALTRWMTSLDGTHISSQSFAPAWRAAPTDDPPTSGPRHAPCAPPFSTKQSWDINSIDDGRLWNIYWYNLIYYRHEDLCSIITLHDIVRIELLIYIYIYITIYQHFKNGFRIQVTVPFHLFFWGEVAIGTFPRLKVLQVQRTAYHWPAANVGWSGNAV